MTESTAGSGWTAFLGATVFEFGSLLGILEAWNRDDTTHHGWETEEKQTPTTDKSHHDSDSDYPENGSNQSSPRNRPSNQWKWFSTQRKYWHELGFLAAAVQFVAATIFWISGFTSIPSIHDSIDDQGLLDGVFWSPQVVGGAGFILSSVLMVIETQKKWFVPAPLNIGWQVGSWNLVGSVGFTLCGALGYAANTSSRAMYQSSLSTFWGGWAFLIGSLFQWYESVNSLS